MGDSRASGTNTATNIQFRPISTVWLSVILALTLMVAACGDDGDAISRAAGGPDDAASGSAATEQPRGTDEASPDAPGEDDDGSRTGGDSGSVVVVMGERTYEPSVREDIPIRGPGGEDLGAFPTRCNPAFFGGYWVIGVGVDESGERLDPGYVVEASLWPADSDQENEFQIDDDIEGLDWRLEGAGGDWTVEGTRASGRVTLKELSTGEVATATFEFACPA